MLGVYKVSHGSMTGTVVDTRLILAVGLKKAAVSMILCHNHPSGNLKASTNDMALTKKIKAAGDLVEIKVMDHLIISDESYASFADEGIM